MSEISKSCRNLLPQGIMKWMQIPFGIPKYFFNIRPCVGAELFALGETKSVVIPTWRDEDALEMSTKLFDHAVKSDKKPGVSGRLDWNNSGGEV